MFVLCYLSQDDVHVMIFVNGKYITQYLWDNMSVVTEVLAHDLHSLIAGLLELLGWSWTQRWDGKPLR